MSTPLPTTAELIDGTHDVTFARDITASVASSAGGRYTDAETAILVLVIGGVSFLTLAGNILVITAFARDEKLRSFGNYFILNLSLTDLCVGALIPLYAPYTLLGRWPYGRRACVIFNVVDYIVPLASSWNIAVISLDRYISVSRPIMYRLKQSPRWAVLFMLIPWLAGFLIFAPAIILWEPLTGHSTVPEGQCMVDYYNHMPYLLFGSFMEFIVPFVTVAAANLLIYMNIRKRSRAMNRVHPIPSVGAMAANQESESHKASLARDKKTARSLAVLVGVYGLTWAPYEVCALANPLCGFCIPDQVFEVTFWLLWVNSTINPILYPFLQHKFRVAFRRLLCCSPGGADAPPQATLAIRVA